MAPTVGALEMGSGGHRWNCAAHHCIREFLALGQASGSLTLRRHTRGHGLPRKVESLLNRRLNIALKSLALLIAAGLVSGIVYEQIGRRRDRVRFPQIGRSVDIGGRTLNIFCSGTGAPAVILDTGGDNPGLAWEETRAEIAKFTQACWYDRAGIGWSDSGPYPRTSAAIAADLHELFKRAGIPPPYVLLGGSIGGLNARVFAEMYPKDTAGVVLDDAAHEDEPLRAPKFYLGHQAPRALWRSIH